MMPTDAQFHIDRQEMMQETLLPSNYYFSGQFYYPMAG